jgi:hypothetical protein
VLAVAASDVMWFVMMWFVMMWFVMMVSFRRMENVMMWFVVRDDGLL